MLHKLAQYCAVETVQAPARGIIGNPHVEVSRRPVESAHCASAQITEFAVANGITRSMGLTATCWDNAMAESFFATFCTESCNRRVRPAQARVAREVGAWIEDSYNQRRRPSVKVS